MLGWEQEDRILAWAAATEIFPLPPLNHLQFGPFPTLSNPWSSPSPPTDLPVQHGMEEEMQWVAVAHMQPLAISLPWQQCPTEQWNNLCPLFWDLYCWLMRSVMDTSWIGLKAFNLRLETFGHQFWSMDTFFPPWHILLSGRHSQCSYSHGEVANNVHTNVHLI